jgi:peptidyl-prolyl cis-trans isomerase SurA
MKIFCVLLIAVASLSLPAYGQLVNAIKAVVHDAVVTQFEVEYNAEAVVDSLRRQYRGQPEAFQRELYKSLNEIFEERLKRQLILHDFKAGGYNIPEPILESAIQEEVDRRGGREKLTKALQAQGRTFEKFRQQTRESIIMSALRAKNVSQELIISPHRIEAYYLANKDKYKVDEEVKLRRIMLNAPSEADVAATRTLA